MCTISAYDRFRTRKDPFEEVWEEAKGFLEMNPNLEVTALFRELQRLYPGKFQPGQLHTLQRHVKCWKATEGPPKEVYFAQEYKPGDRVQSDFTCMDKLGVTIGGVPFKHKLFHFVLTYSSWQTGSVCRSESFEALSEGLQNALQACGGVPRLHQTEAAELPGAAKLVLLRFDGAPLELIARRNIPTRKARRDEWCSGLTAMRKVQCSTTDARVVLGGQVVDYRGCMPGVAEEALLSLRSSQPLFLVGGFGGCARDVAETIGLVEPWTRSRSDWPGRRKFKGWTGKDLNNGLSPEENKALASTSYIRDAIMLILRGVNKLRQQTPAETYQAEHSAYAQGIRMLPPRQGPMLQGLPRRCGTPAQNLYRRISKYW